MRNHLFVALITLFYGLTFILTDFAGIDASQLSEWFILAARWLFVVVSTYFIVYLLAVNKYVFAVLFPVFTVVCTIISYFRYTVKVELTQMVVDLALVNDLRTDIDVVSWKLIVIVLMALTLSVFVVIFRFRRVSFEHAWLHFLLAIAGIAAVNSTWQTRLALSRRIPYSVFYSVLGYVDNRNEISNRRLAFGGTPECHADSLTVVFVLGESLRASNMQINGYERPTTPLLAKEKNVVSLPNVFSEHPYTHTSVPYILTRADHMHQQRAYTERSFVSILKKAGYYTAWIANQESVATFAYFMNETDTLDYVNSGKSLYVMSQWLDEDIIPSYERLLKSNRNRKCFIIHTIGSHWFYNSHYPEKFARWQPTARSKVISENTLTEMRNSYDNTILYSDWFWHELIERLRGENAVLIYLSDHAECMGEDGYMTHGTDHPALHRPACFVWFSEKYAQNYPKKVAALQKNRMKRYNSSFLFHSVISAADVKIKYINHQENIFY